MLIFLLLATMFTANDLKQQCASTQTDGQIYCLGYLRGIPDGAIAATILAVPEMPEAELTRIYQRVTGCGSEGVLISQVKLIFLKYVDNHPEELHLPAALIVQKSLVAAFPCRQ